MERENQINEYVLRKVSSGRTILKKIDADEILMTCHEERRTRVRCNLWVREGKELMFYYYYYLKHISISDCILLFVLGTSVYTCSPVYYSFGVAV